VSRYLGLEVRRVLRDRMYLLFTIGFPVLIYIFFSQVGVTRGTVSGTDGDAYSMVSMAAFAAISATVFLGGRISAERAAGWTSYLRVTPLSSGAYVGVKVLSGVLTALPCVVLVLLAGTVINGVPLSAVDWLAIVGALTLGAVPFAALGVALGYAARGASAQPVVAGSYMTLSMFGGLWFPAALMPKWMAHIAHVLPTYHFADFGWKVLVGRVATASDYAVLAAWGVGFCLLAALAYRRDTADSA
jgi:ABC-2 type transport system permease protein